MRLSHPLSVKTDHHLGARTRTAAGAAGLPLPFGDGGGGKVAHMAQYESISIDTIDRDQFAAALGVNVSTLDKWVRSGRVPRPLKLGRAVRWHRAAILDWLRAGGPSEARRGR